MNNLLLYSYVISSIVTCLSSSFWRLMAIKFQSSLSAISDMVCSSNKEKTVVSFKVICSLVLDVQYFSTSVYNFFRTSLLCYNVPDIL